MLKSFGWWRSIRGLARRWTFSSRRRDRSSPCIWRLVLASWSRDHIIPRARRRPRSFMRKMISLRYLCWTGRTGPPTGRSREARSKLVSRCVQSMLAVRPRRGQERSRTNGAKWFSPGRAREEGMNTTPAISVNERAAKLVARLVADAAELRIGVSRGDLGEMLIDAGSKRHGSIAAGLRIAEICMGGLG